MHNSYEFFAMPLYYRLDFADVSLECVEEFCYLGNMICAGGGAEASSIVRVRCGWKKFR